MVDFMRRQPLHWLGEKTRVAEVIYTDSHAASQQKRYYKVKQAHTLVMKIVVSVRIVKNRCDCSTMSQASHVDWNTLSKTDVGDAEAREASCGYDPPSESLGSVAKRTDIVSDNENTNYAPTGENSRPVSPRQSLLATNVVAGDTNRTHHGPRPRSTSSAASNASTSFIVYFLLLLRDLLTFFTRGGLSAMMFTMDQVLRVMVLIAEVVLGPTGSQMLSYPCRIALWVYQLSLWVVYTMVELLFYLPWQVLVIYVLGASLLMLLMPSPLLGLLTGLFSVLHRFIGLYKLIFSLFLGGADVVVAGNKD